MLLLSAIVLVLAIASGAILARAISCIPLEILALAQDGGRYVRLSAKDPAGDRHPRQRSRARANVTG